MPIFFFDVSDDGDVLRSPDVIGTEHPNKECIPDEVADLLANIARDHLPDCSNYTFSVSVRDSDERVIYKATLALRADGYDRHVLDAISAASRPRCSHAPERGAGRPDQLRRSA